MQRRRLVAVLAIVLVLVLIGVAIAGGGDDEPTPRSRPVTGASTPGRRDARSRKDEFIDAGRRHLRGDARSAVANISADDPEDQARARSSTSPRASSTSCARLAPPEEDQAHARRLLLRARGPRRRARQARSWPLDRDDTTAADRGRRPRSTTAEAERRATPPTTTASRSADEAGEPSTEPSDVTTDATAPSDTGAVTPDARRRPPRPRRPRPPPPARRHRRRRVGRRRRGRDSGGVSP